MVGLRGNYALIRWEGRKFPSLSIQGDSLAIFAETLAEAGAELARGNLEDAAFALLEGSRTVTDMRKAYEEMVSEVGTPTALFSE
ncbi:DUF6959 family protein [Nocardia inohanensis]|uniref:DUF6959 family protein n=1 Tax=Nocardia inohanensis TaxID=209246 RepID=UPI003F761661